NQSLDAFCRAASLEELMAEAGELEAFRRRSENRYQRVRALLFLYALHRFHLPLKPGLNPSSRVSFLGYTHLLQRRFEEASATFFLGMDYPERAKVLNVSIDLGVRGRDSSTRPPIETYLRVIDEPLLRLTTVDLAATADLTNLADVFDFAKDYLGLLKAAVIA